MEKARDNKLTIEDMAGGTFTISNVSSDTAPRQAPLFTGFREVSLAP